MKGPMSGVQITDRSALVRLTGAYNIRSR